MSRPAPGCVQRNATAASSAGCGLDSPVTGGLGLGESAQGVAHGLSRGGDARGMEDEFALFWAMYPRFGRQAPPLARRAFAKARSIASLDTILMGLERYIGHLEVHDWLKPCYAATWLNQQRWSGEYDSPTNAPGAAKEIPFDTLRWKLRIKSYKQNSFWLPFWGEKPDDPRCAAPVEVLSEFGFRAMH